MANVVRRIVIENLYDNYNYDITFHKGGITLITGPNGFGKTTVLNIIKNALEQNFFYFFELLFKKIVLYFDDSEVGSRLIIDKVKRRQNALFDEEVEYTIVGSTEVDLAKNRISNVSPIGAALIGAKKNQIVEANTPGGLAKYKVLNIKK